MKSLATSNVLMITLDCCRADTFAAAELPFMKSLGYAASAQTHGTYTLPAHMSFFCGYLPGDRSSRLPYYNPDVRQLWRLQSGRARDPATVGLMLNGANVLEGYRSLGFYILGTGGVRWFRNKTLTGLFDDFMFYGPDDYASVFAPRKPEDFALNHQEAILEKIEKSGRNNTFLFVDCLETHVPYDTGDETLPAEVSSILERGAPIWGCKSRAGSGAEVSVEELQSLHRRQIKALETVDAKVKKLVERLPKPLLVVITGDHGECFGEDGLWGHGYPAPKVMEVPLVIGFVER